MSYLAIWSLNVSVARAAPYGMYQLPDGSILVATSTFGPNSAIGYNIFRITQTNGVANAPTPVFTGGVGPTTDFLVPATW